MWILLSLGSMIKATIFSEYKNISSFFKSPHLAMASVKSLISEVYKFSK